MNNDPGILCFKHCKGKIFSFSLPEKCPICNQKLLNDKNHSGILPFRIPYPFVRGTQQKCSVILKPTVGDFLNNYNNNMDLHIAVTSSNGEIIEFDRHGLRQSMDDQWDQCLNVATIPEAWDNHWDEILEQTQKEPLWRKEFYDKDKHNCYSFVLSFLSKLNYGGLSRLAMNRMLFCEKIIVPRTVLAAKYISLYRKIRDSGFYVHLSQH